MIRTVLKFTIFYLTISLLISCDKESDEKRSNTQNENLIPLKINNSWTYNEINYDSFGNILNVYPVTFKVLYDTILDSKKCFTTNFLNDISNNTYTYLSDGLYRAYDFGTYIMYKYPAQNNDSFMIGLQVKYIKTNVQVVVPAGKFLCYNYYYYLKYYYNSKEIRINDYLCPGIGLIKSEKASIYNNTIAYIYKTYELREYNLIK
jgi:hypothetical protein